MLLSSCLVVHTFPQNLQSCQPATGKDHHPRLIIQVVLNSTLNCWCWSPSNAMVLLRGAWQQQELSLLLTLIGVWTGLPPPASTAARPTSRLSRPPPLPTPAHSFTMARWHYGTRWHAEAKLGQLTILPRRIQLNLSFRTSKTSPLAVSLVKPDLGLGPSCHLFDLEDDKVMILASCLTIVWLVFFNPSH